MTWPQFLIVKRTGMVLPHLCLIMTNNKMPKVQTNYLLIITVTILARSKNQDVWILIHKYFWNLKKKQFYQELLKIFLPLIIFFNRKSNKCLALKLSCYCNHSTITIWRYSNFLEANCNASILIRKCLGDHLCNCSV